MFARLRPLAPYLRRYSRDFVWGGLAVILSNAIWIFFPQVIRIAIDDLNRGVTREKIFRYAALLVVISAAKGVFLFLTRWIMIGISREIEFDLRNDLFRHLERQPAAYFQQHRTGDIMARMTNDLNAVRSCWVRPSCTAPTRFCFHRGALFSAAHQPVAYAGGAGAAASRQHPGADAGPKDPRAFRAHSGDVFGDLGTGAGEFFRRPAGASVCPGRSADCGL